ncbi:hypothetical protein [Algoriphagus sediminis]|uniref:HTTM domain-containing protein n=1 Tax=Algoriphagus sediminis TaxID=3057113 RepID=A0ABT7YEV5_9BACT|nr:hypothetical protein [Algoriphagus sediminis]MDN3205054.1 hypothetical protein [Algoriphagus sediminis]
MLSIKAFLFKPLSAQEALLFPARMIVIYLLWLRGMRHILPPFLPFIEILDSLREMPSVYFMLDVLYWIAVISILFGFKFQKFSLLLAFLIFFQILSSRSVYSTSFLFSGCILFLIGLFKPCLSWTFRVQIGLLYLGAGINKLLHPDWLSGVYFEYFISTIYANGLNNWMTDLVGLEPLALFFSFSTIIIELSLSVWAFSSKKPLLLGVAILIFHLLMLIFTFGELSYLYFYLMAVAAFLLMSNYNTTTQTINSSKRVTGEPYRGKKSFLKEKNSSFAGEECKENQSSFLFSSKTWTLFNTMIYFFLVVIIVYASRHSEKIIFFIDGS